jgi:hypothetical protein
MVPTRLAHRANKRYSDCTLCDVDGEIFIKPCTQAEISFYEASVAAIPNSPNSAHVSGSLTLDKHQDATIREQGAGAPSAPSVAETDKPSGYNSSSQSQTSSADLDFSKGKKDEDNAQSETTLEDLVKNHVLRVDPEVADLFIRAVDGQLEAASGGNIEQLEDVLGLSFLRLLQPPRFSDTKDRPGLTLRTPSYILQMVFILLDH